MGLFDLFKKKPSRRLDRAQTLRGETPIYTNFFREEYTSDAVQAAIQCIVSEMRKLSPVHIRKASGDEDSTTLYDSDIQKVLDFPNQYMTTTEFIEKTIWELFQKFNAFIIPTYSTYKTKNDLTITKLTGLYPIAPTQTEFEQNSEGDLFITFRFPNNFQTTLPYSSVIHLRYRFNLNDLMGGNEFGQPDNSTLKETLGINKQILDGLALAMQTSLNINGIVKYNSVLDKGKMAAAIDEFDEKLRNNASGVLPLDLRAEYTPVKRDIKLIDPATIRFLDEKILRFFGVPLPILTGDYSPAQFEAFYDKTLEPLIISLSQAFTKTLFTPMERSFGNRIIFQPGELVFMSADQKLQMIRLLGDSGTIFENEKRRAIGLEAIPELEGVRMQSLNYVDSRYAREYQTGPAGRRPNNTGNDGGSEDGNTEL
jgi:HK97 family phage portal protein